ncbi:MAG: sugar phosphate isomerase/epimerase [Pirellulales bacterium]|nr:sugar phosphate isomerase/epimerase [Pirellulales bacterium]
MASENRFLTRRAILSRSALAAGAVLGAHRFAPLFAATAARGFKIGACDWSLRKQCDPAPFDVAKRIGLDGVQVSMGSVANDMHLRRPDVQKTYLEAAERTGLEIASLGIGEMNSVPLKSDPRAARWLADSIDVCTALGLTVSMPACFAAGDLDMGKTDEIDHLVKVLKDVAPKAEKRGVLIGLENYLSAEDNLRIIERVGSPAIKVYYDVGNSTDKGRDIHKEIRLLGKTICEFHFKDGKHLLGQGRIDFRLVRKTLDEIGYSGWVVLESAVPHGVIPDYTAQCKYLRPLFPPTV